MELVFIWLIAVIIVNLIFSAIVGYVASQKGRSFGGFFALSFFLSFLVGILVVIAIPRREVPVGVSRSTNFVMTDEGEKAKCPFCAEWVKSEASVCKHCGKDIAEELAAFRGKEDNERREHEAKVEAAYKQKAEESVARQDLRRERSKNFLQSKTGKVLVSTTGLVVVVGMVIAAVQIGTTLSEQQQAQAQLEAKNVSLAKDCALISERLTKFNTQTQQSTLSKGLAWGDHAKLAQSSARREVIKSEVERILPKLVVTDERFSAEYGELSFPRAVRVAQSVLYNQAVEGTNFPLLQSGDITKFALIPDELLPLFANCKGDVYDNASDALNNNAKAWGEAVLVIRQCKLVGKLWSVPCG